ncbi:hypothetical protein ACTL6U_06985 [Rhodovibrionaceae bacterium A322]
MTDYPDAAAVADRQLGWLSVRGDLPCRHHDLAGPVGAGTDPL